MSESSLLLHVCKICGKKFATFKAVCGHQRIHSTKRKRMVEEEDDDEIWSLCSVSSSDNEISSESETFDDDRASSHFYVCKICGKSFENVRAMCGHMRIHSGKSNRMEDDNEMNEAAISLVMFSKRAHGFAAIENSTDLELKTGQEKILHSGLDFSELLSQKSSTCNDVFAQALPYPLRRKFQGCSQALGDHQRVHRLMIKGKLSCKEDIGDASLLSGATDSEAKKCFKSEQKLLRFSHDISKEDLFCLPKSV